MWWQGLIVRFRVMATLSPRRWHTGVLVALLLVAGAFVVSGQTPTLRLVSTPWSPFTNEAGKPRFALDLVDAAFGRIG